ncbi:MAG: hypothetical protein F4018_02055 [Acidobacteria bacterium]|nr:hypothetical protein [Gammaproteobacteria bacterium]MYK87217.1 hypothetical protein [Acidobacteriota bacterium]
MTVPHHNFRRALRRLAALAGVALLGACAGTGDFTAPFRGDGDAGLSDVQACAVGYDLARQVHERVALRRTVLLAPARENSCERHALEYLRRTGFRIDETGQGGVTFDITVDRMDDGDVAAVAEIGGSLRVSRMYTPVATGVLASSAVAVQQLDPDTYLDRGVRW